MADRASYKAALRDAGSLLGLLQQEPVVWFCGPGGEDEDISRIQNLVQTRPAARSTQDYANADRIRNELAALGVIVQDRADVPLGREPENGIACLMIRKNPRGDLPTIHDSAFVDPTAIICDRAIVHGPCKFGDRVFAGFNSVLFNCVVGDGWL